MMGRKDFGGYDNFRTISAKRITVLALDRGRISLGDLVGALCSCVRAHLRRSNRKTKLRLVLLVALQRG
jgi:hypothetical protein